MYGQYAAVSEWAEQGPEAEVPHEIPDVSRIDEDRGRDSGLSFLQRANLGQQSVGVPLFDLGAASLGRRRK